LGSLVGVSAERGRVDDGEEMMRRGLVGRGGVLAAFIACSITALVLAVPGAEAAAPAGASLRPIPGGGGLSNPRGIDIVNGAIVVAESGRGGSTCKMASTPEGGPGKVCFGMTGAITRIANGHQTTLVRLPSLADPTGEAATGPSDVSGLGPDYRFHLTGFIQGVVPRFGSAAARLGDLLKTNGHRTLSVANLARYEAHHNPDGGAIDSNPYSVQALGDRKGVLVTDAAGNSLLRVNPKTGAIRLVATFPTQLLQVPGAPPGTRIPADAVPTSVTIGPDGAWYVAELKGFPFTPGTSRIWRIKPGSQGVHCRVNGTGACSLYATGFTSVVSIDFGPDGALYVSEIAKNGLLGAPNGALLRVKNGVRKVLIGTGLFAPGGIAVSSSGRVFIVNNSISPNQGRVLEVVGG
jgi:hypothetical protein